jgi:hypothetical protein
VYWAAVAWSAYLQWAIYLISTCMLASAAGRLPCSTPTRQVSNILDSCLVHTECCAAFLTSVVAWVPQVQNQQMQAVRQLEGATGSGPCKLHIRNLHVAMSVRSACRPTRIPHSTLIT